MPRFTFAPMEGITGRLYRSLHHRFFGGADCYYTPFLALTQNHVFSPRELRDIDPEANRGIPLIPQVLTKNADDFLWCAGELAAMGYGEVNLNCGCPSGTVTAKGKGAGMLADLPALEAFLDRVCPDSPLPISVKLRLGLRDPEEFWPILELLEGFPLREVILHPRVKDELYRGRAHREYFERALAQSALPMGYNGDLDTAEECLDFARAHPAASSVMVGRGLLRNPALLRQVKGGPPARMEELRSFYEALYAAYCAAFGSPVTALGPMKELWFYQLEAMNGPRKDKLQKALKKCRTEGEYRSLSAEIFTTLTLS